MIWSNNERWQVLIRFLLICKLLSITAVVPSKVQPAISPMLNLLEPFKHGLPKFTFSSPRKLVAQYSLDRIHKDKGQYGKQLHSFAGLLYNELHVVRRYWWYVIINGIPSHRKVRCFRRVAASVAGIFDDVKDKRVF
jgi:hypothetical protein